LRKCCPILTKKASSISPARVMPRKSPWAR
jgi:hypothetical protein